MNNTIKIPEMPKYITLAESLNEIYNPDGTLRVNETDVNNLFLKNYNLLSKKYDESVKFITKKLSVDLFLLYETNTLDALWAFTNISSEILGGISNYNRLKNSTNFIDKDAENYAESFAKFTKRLDEFIRKYR